MKLVHKTVLMTAMLGAGLASQAGAALADDDHHDGDTQSGIANLDDTQTIVPTNVCGNDVPVNVLGVQVPIQNLAGDIPILSPSDDGGGNAAGIEKSCGTEVDAES